MGGKDLILKKMHKHKGNSKKRLRLSGKISKINFSLGINNHASQNKTVEPPTRKKNKTISINVLWHHILQ
jgi:hypothetical protein